MPTTEILDFDIPIKSESQLRRFLDCVGIRIPATRVCPNHNTPWEAFRDAFFARSRNAIWHGGRGCGKSYLLAALGFTEAAMLGADVNILGGSGEQSRRVNEYLNRHWYGDSGVSALLKNDPNLRQTSLHWGNKITALMASETSVRGPHLPRLRCDEIDLIKQTLLDAALGQTMSTAEVPAQTVFSSTWQVPDGTMAEMLKRARDKKWPVYQWCPYEISNPVDGWMPALEVEAKRADIPARMWEIEYMLGEPLGENRAINSDCVAVMFNSEFGDFDGALHEYIEIEPPDPEGTYATGTDWARAVDYTIIATLRTDVIPYRLVAFQRTGRVQWPRMTKLMDERLRRYPGVAAHDRTGLGDVVDSFLACEAQGVVLTGKVRHAIITDYIAAIESLKIEAPNIVWARDEHAYAEMNDLYGTGHLPDSICAMALAWWAAGNVGTYSIT